MTTASASAPPRARTRRRRRPQPFTTYFLAFTTSFLPLLAFASASAFASKSPPRRKLQQAVATGAWYCQFPRATRNNDAYTQQNCRAGCDSSGVNKNPRCCVEAGNVCNDEEANAARLDGVQCEPQILADCTPTPAPTESTSNEPPSPVPALSTTTASPTTFSLARPSRTPTRAPTFTPNVLPTQDQDKKGKGEGTSKGKSLKNLHIALIAGIGGLLLALCCLFICCLSIRRSRWGRRQQQVRGEGGGGRLNNLHAPPLAVAALYYDEDDNNGATAAAAGSPGVHNPIIYGPGGALIGQPLERPRSPLPPPSAPPPIVTTSSAVVPLPRSLSPPTSPAFDPFSVGAIDYMGLSGEWPSTPTALAATAAGAGAGGTRTLTFPPPATSSPQARQSVTRVATGGAAAGSRLSFAAPPDGYADLMRLLVSSSSSSSSSSSPPPSPLLLHATDLRINPLPYRLQAHQALYRGRFGCTLPPPLPVVAVASPIAQTGSNRTIVVPVTGTSSAGSSHKGEEEGHEEGEEHTLAGVPIVVQTIYASIPRSAASVLHDELRRWKALPAHLQLLTLRGVACWGDKRRLSVVWDAWPKGRTTLRAWLFPPPPSTVQGRPTSHTGSSSSSRKKQQSLDARYALLGQVGRQLVDALMHLHAQGLGHGDLRPGNVWMDARTLTLKVGPPSLVRMMESSALAAMGRGDDEEGRGLEEEEEEVEAFRPPERQTDQAPTTAGDMYALAILLWTLWTREKPYESLGLGRPELRSAVVGQGLRPTWGSRGEGGGGEGGDAVPLPRALEELLIEMWAAAPEARPTNAVVQQKLAALQRAM